MNDSETPQPATDAAADTAPETGAEHVAAPRRSLARTLGKWAIGIVVGIVLLIAAGVAILNSPIGHRFVVDQIAKVAPASGLRVRIGRIDGNLYGTATLHDVTLSDPKGAFLRVPRVDLDWRPLHWFSSGLDVRELVTHRGTLLRRPELLPGDPDAPILPNFDIRVDRLQIRDLTIAKGIAGDKSHKVNLLAQANIRSGKVYLKADGKLGAEDRLHALIDAEPDGDKFDIDADYIAAKDGVLAGLIGADAGYRGKVFGNGTWTQWKGGGVVTRDGERFVAFQLRNYAGTYSIAGQAQPAPLLDGIPARLAGKTVSYLGVGTLDDSVLDGKLQLIANGLRGSADGTLDLGNNLARKLAVDARLTDPALLGPDSRIEGLTLKAMLDGKFRDLSVAHTLSLAKFTSGSTQLSDVVQKGTATYDGTRWVLPLNATVGRVVTGSAQVDPRLIGGTLSGTVTYAGSKLASDRLALKFPGAEAQLALAGDTDKGTYRLSGPVVANGLALDNVGTINAAADIDFAYGQGPWTLSADFQGRIPRVTNGTIANLAGPDIRLRGGVTMAANTAITFRNLRVNAARLTLFADGTVGPDRSTLRGRGKSADYGPFTVEGGYTSRGPEAVLVFADPLPAAGLKDVRVALAPIEGGFGIETKGESMLGPFAGTLGLYSPANGPTRLAIEKLDIWKTSVTGELVLGDGGADGTLTLAGGGLDGTVAISPRDGGQAFAVDLKARKAAFGGATPLSISSATITGNGLLKDGSSTINGNIVAQGVGYDGMYLSRMSAQAKLVNGSGTVTAALAGRRGSPFVLQLDAKIAPDRYAVAARGNYAGKAIAMPRRAVVVKREDGGWQLQPTQVNFAGGAMIAQGTFDNGQVAGRLQLADMPLSLADLAGADLGLDGKVSGVVDIAGERGGLPTGEARVKIDGLSRSGLVLTSRPVDLALVLKLTQDQLATRAVIDDADGKRLGRLQGRISGLPQDGGLADRLRAGSLFAQLRYSGPADALWRLAAINTFDLTGPLSVAADVTGTLSSPQVRGSLASDNMRLRSGLSGTDISKVKARGTFSGSRLRLTSFSGTAPNGGTVVGSGTVDLSEMSADRGPQLDLRLAARNAALLDANGLTATVTGPMRIVSRGFGGTIAGRLRVNRASWRMGMATAASELPQIRTREINVPPDMAPRQARTGPWRYMIDATAEGGVDVRGMGLDSEWDADIRLRGTTDDPRIGGRAQVVRGDYTFASTQFDLTRGRITFDESVPIDPRLDIVAETTKNDLTVTVKVQGNAMQPEITFSSNPAYPEEEILSRLLFGGSITSLSATDALQLGAAVASLQGGGGLDPINQLRSAIGLDRLRIVSADPAINRETSVALGKNIGRKFYVEIITDGRGYSATNVEFRITSWLSLLGSISTIGRDSIGAKASKDY
ncbi:translocation/assembly module TamB domain-containing protein [Altererythrobacter sp. N1]|nr:translocation/assembly module TamB domain-containing protein [Altererythrobacter sp. N1]